jgi:AGZA family xanthine/uracil permease-like MFS transporter
MTGSFIGLGGILGYVSFIVELIPRAVLAPILVFVALDIMVQAFLACPARHAPAVAFAHLPSMARLLAIKLGDPAIVPAERFRTLLTTTGAELPQVLVTIALGNGFIITAMLWAAFLAEMIDRRLKRAAFYLTILAGLTFFGVVHSASPDGNVYLPWRLGEPVQRAVAYQFAIGYLVLAIVLVLLSLTRESREPPPADLGHLS